MQKISHNSLIDTINRANRKQSLGEILLTALTVEILLTGVKLGIFKDEENSFERIFNIIKSNLCLTTVIVSLKVLINRFSSKLALEELKSIKELLERKKIYVSLESLLNPTIKSVNNDVQNIDAYGVTYDAINNILVEENNGDLVCFSEETEYYVDKIVPKVKETTVYLVEQENKLTLK